MNEPLLTIDRPIDNNTIQAIQPEPVTALESGQILYCTQHPFVLHQAEKILLTDTILHPKHKNISYNFTRQQLGGLKTQSSKSDELSMLTVAFMRRYAEFAHQLVTTLIPEYGPHLRFGRTSYRPAEIKNRQTSKRKDDTRLHVDAFAATPVNGLRILRVFCNINPHALPRIWEVGEPFHQVLHQFSKKVPTYSPIRAKLLQLVKATKSLRSHYDHLMLHLHDQMKLDDHYQQTVSKQRYDFPAGTTWMVFTDSVSHAALGGQYLLEQTFYLPVSAMQNPDISPLKQWESLRGTLTHEH
jgi:hypothetical protein